jgi:hypothetical protein
MNENVARLADRATMERHPTSGTARAGALSHLI